MISTCLMGQTGPLSSFAGFGNLAAALSGFYNLVGWPDRAPSGPFSAYTDYIAPRFGAVAVVAALIHRKRTGKGQYIDQAQAESALHFLARLSSIVSLITGYGVRPLTTMHTMHLTVSIRHWEKTVGLRSRAAPKSTGAHYVK